MDDSSTPTTTDRLARALESGSAAVASRQLRRLTRASTEERKAALRVVRTHSDDDPATVASIVDALVEFLDDDDRTVRLRTVKLLVDAAAATPDAVSPHVAVLAVRLADEDEFYFVRARAAEALGYVALDRPESVTSPEVLADLRVGLLFEESEVREKLAKALEHVALGDPHRLRHHVSNLAPHLDDDSPLVRYHLCTALVAIGCASPERLVEGVDELAARLTDDNEYVLARAAEGLGLLALSADGRASIPGSVREALAVDPEEPFAAERVRFARDALTTDDGAVTSMDQVATLESLRHTMAEAAEAVRSPAGEGCPHCGLALPEEGPPLCPQCGMPY